MIDLHLLLRISSDDTEFRKRVMTKIYAKGQAFERDLRTKLWVQRKPFWLRRRVPTTASTFLLFQVGVPRVKSARQQLQG